MKSRNAYFFENIFPCLTKEIRSLSRIDDGVVQDKRQRDDNDLQDERQDQPEQEKVEPRRSKRGKIMGWVIHSDVIWGSCDSALRWVVMASR
ncbi:hypothetical protein Tco_0496757, partial [Tanacetum coccineum]